MGQFVASSKFADRAANPIVLLACQAVQF